MDQQRIGRVRRALVRIVIAAAAIGAMSGTSAVALADSSASVLPPEWHVHDGLGGSLGPQHKAIGFFPTILGISTSDYLLDPARCPNATDKALLPSSGQAQTDLVRAGVCFTDSYVIQLRTVPVGTDGPDGWASVTVGGQITYYQLTPR